eukprot:TRINITY_DN6895_c0_g1_i1.p1 TRINITY_DN6895_c0_g1~~TRINITY_DN6895_c0_g1_i1.p1  ORF type:complete len:349 (-),score=25.13 TRINITY_DN6895_c0_g1_i1:63-1031(-)
MFGSFTNYRMDEINLASVILFLHFAVFVACSYKSFAHRKTLKRLDDGFISGLGGCLILVALLTSAVLVNQYILRFVAGTSNLDFIISGTSATVQEAHAHASRLFQSGGMAGLSAALLHVGSWSVALVSGAVLIKNAASEPVDLPSVPYYAYLVAVVVVGISTASCFGAASFSFFLFHPEASDSRFYKEFPASVWNVKIALLWFKTAIFVFSARCADIQRTVEWLVFSYGEIMFYPLFFVCLWLFESALPVENGSSYQDCWAHAALVAQLGGILGFYVPLIYAFEPQQDDMISAVRNGLFSWKSRFRDSSKQEPLLAAESNMK